MATVIGWLASLFSEAVRSATGITTGFQTSRSLILLGIATLTGPMVVMFVLLIGTKLLIGLFGIGLNTNRTLQIENMLRKGKGGGLDVFDKLDVPSLALMNGSLIMAVISALASFGSTFSGLLFSFLLPILGIVIPGTLGILFLAYSPPIQDVHNTIQMNFFNPVVSWINIAVLMVLYLIQIPYPIVAAIFKFVNSIPRRVLQVLVICLVDLVLPAIVGLSDTVFELTMSLLFWISGGMLTVEIPLNAPLNTLLTTISILLDNGIQCACLIFRWIVGGVVKAIRSPALSQTINAAVNFAFSFAFNVVVIPVFSLLTNTVGTPIVLPNITRPYELYIVTIGNAGIFVQDALTYQLDIYIVGGNDTFFLMVNGTLPMPTDDLQYAVRAAQSQWASLIIRGISLFTLDFAWQIGYFLQRIPEIDTPTGYLTTFNIDWWYNEGMYVSSALGSVTNIPGVCTAPGYTPPVPFSQFGAASFAVGVGIGRFLFDVVIGEIYYVRWNQAAPFMYIGEYMNSSPYFAELRLNWNYLANVFGCAVSYIDSYLGTSVSGIVAIGFSILSFLLQLLSTVRALFDNASPEILNSIGLDEIQNNGIKIADIGGFFYQFQVGANPQTCRTQVTFLCNLGLGITLTVTTVVNLVIAIVKLLLEIIKALAYAFQRSSTGASSPTGFVMPDYLKCNAALTTNSRKLPGENCKVPFTEDVYALGCRLGTAIGAIVPIDNICMRQAPGFCAVYEFQSVSTNTYTTCVATFGCKVGRIIGSIPDFALSILNWVLGFIMEGVSFESANDFIISLFQKVMSLFVYGLLGPLCPFAHILDCIWSLIASGGNGRKSDAPASNIVCLVTAFIVVVLREASPVIILLIRILVTLLSMIFGTSLVGNSITEIVNLFGDFFAQLGEFIKNLFLIILTFALSAIFEVIKAFCLIAKTFDDTIDCDIFTSTLNTILSALGVTPIDSPQNQNYKRRDLFGKIRASIQLMYNQGIFNASNYDANIKREVVNTTTTEGVSANGIDDVLSRIPVMKEAGINDYFNYITYERLRDVGGVKGSSDRIVDDDNNPMSEHSAHLFKNEVIMEEKGCIPFFINAQYEELFHSVLDDKAKQFTMICTPEAEFIKSIPPIEPPKTQDLFPPSSYGPTPSGSFNTTNGFTREVPNKTPVTGANSKNAADSSSSTGKIRNTKRQQTKDTKKSSPLYRPRLSILQEVVMRHFGPGPEKMEDIFDYLNSSVYWEPGSSCKFMFDDLSNLKPSELNPNLMIKKTLKTVSSSDKERVLMCIQNKVRATTISSITTYLAWIPENLFYDTWSSLIKLSFRFAYGLVMLTQFVFDKLVSAETLLSTKYKVWWSFMKVDTTFYEKEARYFLNTFVLASSPQNKTLAHKLFKERIMNMTITEYFARNLPEMYKKDGENVFIRRDDPLMNPFKDFMDFADHFTREVVVGNNFDVNNVVLHPPSSQNNANIVVVKFNSSTGGDTRGGTYVGSWTNNGYNSATSTKTGPKYFWRDDVITYEGYDYDFKNETNLVRHLDLDLVRTMKNFRDTQSFFAAIAGFVDFGVVFVETFFDINNASKSMKRDDNGNFVVVDDDNNNVDNSSLVSYVSGENTIVTVKPKPSFFQSIYNAYINTHKLINQREKKYKDEVRRNLGVDAIASEEENLDEYGCPEDEEEEIGDLSNNDDDHRESYNAYYKFLLGQENEDDSESRNRCNRGKRIRNAEQLEHERNNEQFVYNKTLFGAIYDSAGALISAPHNALNNKSVIIEGIKLGLTLRVNDLFNSPAFKKHKLTPLTSLVASTMGMLNDIMGSSDVQSIPPWCINSIAGIHNISIEEAWQFKGLNTRECEKYSRLFYDEEQDNVYHLDTKEIYTKNPQTGKFDLPPSAFRKKFVPSKTFFERYLPALNSQARINRGAYYKLASAVCEYLWANAYILIGTNGTAMDRLVETYLDVHPSFADYASEFSLYEKMLAKLPEHRSTALRSQKIIKYDDLDAFEAWKQLPEVKLFLNTTSKIGESARIQQIIYDKQSDYNKVLYRGVIERQTATRKKILGIDSDREFNELMTKMLEKRNELIYMNALEFSELQEENGVRTRKASPSDFIKFNSANVGTNSWPGINMTGLFLKECTSGSLWLCENCFVVDVIVGGAVRSTNYVIVAYSVTLPPIMSEQLTLVNYYIDVANYSSPFGSGGNTPPVARIGNSRAMQPWVPNLGRPIGEVLQFSQYELDNGIDLLLWFWNIIGFRMTSFITNGTCFNYVNDYAANFDTQGLIDNPGEGIFGAILYFVQGTLGIPVCGLVDSIWYIFNTSFGNIADYVMYHTVLCNYTDNIDGTIQLYSTAGMFILIGILTVIVGAFCAIFLLNFGFISAFIFGGYLVSIPTIVIIIGYNGSAACFPLIPLNLPHNLFTFWAYTPIIINGPCPIALMNFVNNTDLSASNCADPNFIKTYASGAENGWLNPLNVIAFSKTVFNSSLVIGDYVVNATTFLLGERVATYDYSDYFTNEVSARNNLGFFCVALVSYALMGLAIVLISFLAGYSIYITIFPLLKDGLLLLFSLLKMYESIS